MLVVVGTHLLHGQIHHVHDDALNPGAELLVAGGVAVAPGKDHVGDDVADVVAHGAIEAELRVEDHGGVLIDEDGAGVQVAMDQALGTGHEVHLQLGHLAVELFVVIELLLDEVSHRREHVVAALLVVVGLGVHQTLGDVAQLGGDELALQRLLLLVVHHHVGGAHQHLSHEGGDLIGELGEDLMLQHGGTHDLVIAQILHAAGAHDGVIEVDLGHIAGSQLALEDQNLGLDAVAVGVQLHVLGNTGDGAGLLDDDAVALAVLDFEDVVQVAVTNLLAGHGGHVPVLLGHLQLSVLNGVFGFHQKIGIELRHNFPSIFKKRTFCCLCTDKCQRTN